MLKAQGQQNTTKSYIQKLTEKARHGYTNWSKPVTTKKKINTFLQIVHSLIGINCCKPVSSLQMWLNDQFTYTPTVKEKQKLLRGEFCLTPKKTGN